MEIFVVFQGGGSDEIMLNIYSTRQAAECALEPSSKNFVVRFILNEETQEFMEQATL